MANNSALIIDPKDNVAIARRSLNPGEKVFEVEVTQTIPIRHKVALRRIKAGDPVFMYGEAIGLASTDIEAGQHIHLQNLAFHYAGTRRTKYDLATEKPVPPKVPAGFDTFQGYKLPDGRIATRRYLAVVATGNCSGYAPDMVKSRFPREILKQYPNISGIITITNPYGCGITMKGEAYEQIARTISGTVGHANIAGYVMVGLGCEQLGPSQMAERRLVQLSDLTRQGESGSPFPKTNSGSLLVSVQSHGGNEAVTDSVIQYLHQMLPQANELTRTTVSSNEIILGTNCGGSDGDSGLTANPAVGWLSDFLVALGATTVLGETPETAGAEHILTRRARNKSVARQLIAKVRWWENYYRRFKGLIHPCPTIDNNPSIGNKDGGLTTIVQKSLGAVRKSGTTILNHVLDCAAPIPRHAGLCFMDTPGKDSTSMTSIVAGGANVSVFTTGRGNVAGWAPCPTIKICTNTPTFERLRSDMDFNAGVIADGTATLREVGLLLLQEVLDVASGKITHSERMGADTFCFEPANFGPLI